MSSFAEKYFGGEIARQYGLQNARTNDMKPIELDRSKEVFARYRDADLSTMLRGANATTRSARSRSIDDLIAPNHTAPEFEGYRIPKNLQPLYDAAVTSALKNPLISDTKTQFGDSAPTYKGPSNTDATSKGYFGKLGAQPYQDSSYSP